MDKKQRARRIVGAIILAIILIPLFGLVIMALWNWLMPALFQLPEIGLLQALGLFLLSRALFGSFGGNAGGRHRRSRSDCRYERDEGSTLDESVAS